MTRGVVVLSDTFCALLPSLMYRMQRCHFGFLHLVYLFIQTLCTCKYTLDKSRLNDMGILPVYHNIHRTIFWNAYTINTSDKKLLNFTIAMHHNPTTRALKTLTILPLFPENYSTVKYFIEYKFRPFRESRRGPKQTTYLQLYIKLLINKGGKQKRLTFSFSTRPNITFN